MSDKARLLETSLALPAAQILSTSHNNLAAQSGASLLSSGFNLANTVIGAGILSLPFAFSLVGYASGVILVLLCAFLSGFSIKLLARSMEVTQLRSYEALMNQAFGFKGVVVVSMCIIFLVWIALMHMYFGANLRATQDIGAGTAYIIILGDILPKLIASVDADFLAPSWARWWCSGVCVAYLLPLTLARRISFLGIFSLFSLFSIFAFVVILLVTVAGREHSPDRAVTEQPFRWSDDLFRAFSIIAFSFTCHSTVFPIFNEMDNPTVARIMRVTWTSMGFCGVLYVTSAVAAYVDYVDSAIGIQGDVLLNLSESETGVVSKLVQFFFAVSIMHTYPLCFPPIRQALAGLLFSNQPPAEWPVARFWTVTISAVMLTWLFAMYLPVLDFVFGLTGASAGVTVAFILPSLVFLRLMALPWREKWPVLLLALFGVAVGCLSTVFTVKDYIQRH